MQFTKNSSYRSFFHTSYFFVSSMQFPLSKNTTVWYKYSTSYEDLPKVHKIFSTVLFMLDCKLNLNKKY